MKKTLRLAVGVVGLYGIALAGTALMPSTFALLPNPVADAWAQSRTSAQAEAPAASASRGIVDDPMAKRRRPKLWTIRSRFDSLIQSVATRHGVDPALVKAMVQAESAFDPNAVSRTGARGLMQVLPETASRFAISNLLDPHQNLRAGVKYLKHLIELFDGNVVMAVAAYN
ncbi:MAG TPA: lytic transglycosylase domain-containing protein, partial [Arenicellales bacterium]|nr:lytic transglycosylase domain-containing protein [Arenicellales bacterium]